MAGMVRWPTDGACGCSLGYEPKPQPKGTTMETNYVTRDKFGMYARHNGGPGPALMGADT